MFAVELGVPFLFFFPLWPRRVAAGLRLSLLTLANKRLDVGSIRFFGDGSSTGGSVTILQGERRSDVTVDWLTGRVSLAAR